MSWLVLSWPVCLTSRPNDIQTKNKLLGLDFKPRRSRVLRNRDKDKLSAGKKREPCLREEAHLSLAVQMSQNVLERGAECPSKG